jgi:hypothetical protein
MPTLIQNHNQINFELIIYQQREAKNMGAGRNLGKVDSQFYGGESQKMCPQTYLNAV